MDEFLKASRQRDVPPDTSRIARAAFRAAKAFRGYLQRITSSDIEAWLDSIKAAGRTRNNYRATLCTLFSFARSRGYLPRNERTEAEMTMKASDRRGEIAVYTPKELSVMLTGIEAKFLPLVALGAFAGLRTAEIHRLEWQDIDFHGGNVVVGKHKAKTGQGRIVPILPALKAWLEPHAKATGLVIPQYSGDAPLLRAFRQALMPLRVEMIHNGLRHSFASHRLPLFRAPTKWGLKWATLLENSSRITTGSSHRHMGTNGFPSCRNSRGRLFRSSPLNSKATISLSWSMAIAARGTEEEDRQASESRWSL